MNEYARLEELILNWAADRGIIQNSNAMAQAIKTTEEVAELLKALSKNSDLEAADAYGDVLVTLIIGSHIAGIDLMSALDDAYEVIKDRKGYLTADGIFVKES